MHMHTHTPYSHPTGTSTCRHLDAHNVRPSPRAKTKMVPSRPPHSRYRSRRSLLLLLLLAAAALVQAKGAVWPPRHTSRSNAQRTPRPHRILTTTTTRHRRPSPPSPARRRSTAFHLWGQHHEHEGRELGRSGVWADFKHRIEDTLEDLKDLSDEKDAIRGWLAKERIALEHLEENVHAAWTRTKPFWRIGLKGVVGGTMCLAGAHFGRCVVLFHTMRVTGWPAFERALVEIGKSYSAAREVVKKELDQIVKPRELLTAVTFELNSVRTLIKESQKAMEDGALTNKEVKEALHQAQIDKKRLEYEAWILNQAFDSFAAFSAAVDLPKLRDVGKGLYTGALACVASANSVTVRRLSLAFDLGSILSNNIHCVCATLMERWHSKELARVLPPETRRFLRLAIQVAGTVQGIIIVNTVLPKMSLRISSAALGAAWLTDAIAETMDPWLKAHDGWEPITGRLPYAVLQVGLTVGGYYVQKNVYPGRFPALVERFLTPLSIAEKRLKEFNGYVFWLDVCVHVPLCASFLHALNPVTQKQVVQERVISRGEPVKPGRPLGKGANTGRCLESMRGHNFGFCT